MRIAIVGLNFAPEPVGVGKYTGEMAQWLATRGHTITVVTARPYYPDWKRASAPGRWTWQSEQWNGCRVIRCPIYVPRRITGLRRVLHLGSFAASAVPAVVGTLGRMDIVAAVAPTLLAAPVVLAAARLSRAKSWLHVQDLELDAAHGLGILTGRGGLGRQFESQMMRRFDLVTTVSPKMAAAVGAKGVIPERQALFPNWVDLTAIHPLTKSETLRTYFGIPADACVALYSGSMGKKQGLESVITAARILAADPLSKICVVLAGAGPARADLERRAVGLSNVRFLPLAAPEAFNAQINIADIHLLPQREGASDAVMPSKLGPMLAVGKPVIASVPDDSQIAATMRGAGVVVPPENPAALAVALRRLAADPERRTTMGRIALQIAHNDYAAEKILPMLERRLMSLIGQEQLLETTATERAA